MKHRFTLCTKSLHTYTGNPLQMKIACTFFYWKFLSPNISYKYITNVELPYINILYLQPQSNLIRVKSKCLGQITKSQTRGPEDTNMLMPLSRAPLNDHWQNFACQEIACSLLAYKVLKGKALFTGIYWVLVSFIEKPAETKTSNQLASSLTKSPDSWSGGHEFESLVWTDSSQ